MNNFMNTMSSPPSQIVEILAGQVNKTNFNDVLNNMPFYLK